ncbi:MAG: peroxiredoxin [Solirubrobacterales bacterium]|nr:peroxiredoxin [Solirubrobacterales bacterium]MCB0860585.1 peroxiredoxin [Solirubrobacterales bacterium]
MPVDFTQLPPDLPVPVDDGAADHLTGMGFPDLQLESSDGRWMNLPEELGERAVLFIYPRTGTPGQPLLPGWDDIPGARGCTPQSCGYRDNLAGFRERGIGIFGLSAQTGSAQAEFKQRESIPYDLISDPGLKLAALLRLPTFTISNLTLYRRLTMIVESGRISKVFYPVFPPDQDAPSVLAWFAQEGPGGSGHQPAA